MKVLFFAVSLLLRSPTLAATAPEESGGEEKYLSSDHRRFALLYRGEAGVRVDIFRFAEDHWQERELRKYFSDTEQANAWLRGADYQPAAADDIARLQVQPVLAGEALWTVKQQWNDDWERAFAKWVHEEVDEGFFRKHHLATDCADVAYALRWIFARNHSLPAANRLGGGSRLFSNFEMRAQWRSLPTDSQWHKDRRFVAALNYLLDNTYTHTLFSDSYPVELSLDALSPGSYFLKLDSSTGHTQYIFKKQNDSYRAPFTMISSTTPRMVRDLQVHFFWGNAPENPKKNGFLRTRWAVGTSAQDVHLAEAKAHPWMSMAQYSVPVEGSFSLWLYRQLDPAYSEEKVLAGLLKDIKSGLASRVEVVALGYDFCKRHDCSPGSENYEDWSTPSRDHRLAEQVDLARTFTCSSCGELISTFRDQEMGIDGRNVSYGLMLRRAFEKVFSSDPRDEIKYRWGAFRVTPEIRTSIREFSNYLADREREIDERKSSVIGDAQLQYSVAGLERRFMWEASADLAGIRRALTQEMMSTPRRQMSFQDLREKMAYWSSNAELDPALRWGSAETSPFLALALGPASRVITRDDYEWNRSERSLLDLQRKTFVAPPAGYQWLEYAPNSDNLLLKKEGQVFHARGPRDPHPVLVAALPADAVAGAIFWSQTFIVNLPSAKSLWLFKREGEQVIKISELVYARAPSAALFKTDPNSVGGLLVWGTDGHYSLLTSRRPENWVRVEDLVSSKLEIERDLGKQILVRSADSQRFWIDPLTGHSAPYPVSLAGREMLGISKDGRVIAVLQREPIDVTLYFLDARLQHVEKELHWAPPGNTDDFLLESDGAWQRVLNRSTGYYELLHLDWSSGELLVAQRWEDGKLVHPNFQGHILLGIGNREMQFWTRPRPGQLSEYVSTLASEAWHILGDPQPGKIPWALEPVFGGLDWIRCASERGEYRGYGNYTEQATFFDEGLVSPLFESSQLEDLEKDFSNVPNYGSGTILYSRFQPVWLPPLCDAK